MLFLKAFFPPEKHWLESKTNKQKKMHFRCLTKGFIRGYRGRDSHITNQFLSQVIFKEKKIVSLPFVLRQFPHVALLPLRSRGAGPHLHNDFSLLHLVTDIFLKIPGPNFLFPRIFFFFNKLWALFEVKVGNSRGSRMHFLCLHCLG